MKILKILYYYYYRFYVKYDDEPHATTVFSLSFSESLVINGIVDLICGRFFCYDFSKWAMILVTLLILTLNYLLYVKTGISKEIINKAPPELFGKDISRGFAIVFFLVSTSFLFWEPILSKEIFDHCKSQLY
jgi:hypothetical protein